MPVEKTVTETQYLTFNLDDEIYSIDVSKVREILELCQITVIPGTSEFMRGVINVRGGIVPIIDLRLKFGMPKTIDTENTCIIVLEIKIDNTITIVGALADSVQEVIDMRKDQIETVPKIGTKIDTEFIAGVGKRNDELVIILDIDKIFSEEEIASVKNINGEYEKNDSVLIEQ